MSATAPITDSHCHLDFPQFEGELDDLIARAAARGVHRMVTICTRLRLEPQVRAIALPVSGCFTVPLSAAKIISSLPEIGGDKPVPLWPTRAK